MEWMDIGQTSDDSDVHARKKGENQIYERDFKIGRDYDIGQ